MLTQLDINGLIGVSVKTYEETLRKRIKKKQEKSRTYTDKRRAAHKQVFSSGDYVRIKKPGHVGKGKQKFSAPIRIKKRIRPYTYLMDNGSIWNSERFVLCDKRDITSDVQNN